MAHPRDDHGAPQLPRPPARGRSSVVAPSRSRAVVVGPGAQPDELLQSRLAVAGGLQRSTARRFVVVDRSGGAGTGVIGCRDIQPPLPREMSASVLDAPVAYPAVPRLERIDGRRVIRAGGEGGSAAATVGGRAVVVLVHGIAPSYGAIPGSAPAISVSTTIRHVSPSREVSTVRLSMSGLDVPRFQQWSGHAAP